MWQFALVHEVVQCRVQNVFLVLELRKTLVVLAYERISPQIDFFDLGVSFLVDQSEFLFVFLVESLFLFFRTDFHELGFFLVND